MVIDEEKHRSREVETEREKGERKSQNVFSGKRDELSLIAQSLKANVGHHR
jgi:hypothetical protein